MCAVERLSAFGGLVPVVCMVIAIPGQMALVDPPMAAGVFTSFLVYGSSLDQLEDVGHIICL